MPLMGHNLLQTILLTTVILITVVRISDFLTVTFLDFLGIL